MYVVGLTGGIGSGKSTVAEAFMALGVPVLDTDQVARNVVAPGAPVLMAIKDYFGAEALNDDGSMNRAYMRQRVFTDNAAREKLESLLHPLIREQCWAWLDQQQSEYAILVIPLLLEKGWDEIVDRVLVVDVDEATQRQRVMARDAISAEQVAAIMASQVDRATRVARADDVILNNQAAAELQQQVADLHQRYRQLAQNKGA